MQTKERIIEMLETVLDPELGIYIWTLGLIYDIKIENNSVHIVMTYTTPFCPVGPQLQDEIRAGMNLLGFEKTMIEVVFDPPWQQSAELKAALGLPNA